MVNNLNKNTNYEFKICAVYNNSRGPWSQIQKFKTLDIDSAILNESKKREEFIQIILEWSGYKSMELIYRGTRNGSSAKDFHNKCDDKGPTITLFKNDKGNIFGGYAPISWKNSGGWKSTPDSFIFTLTNIYDIKPTIFNRKNDNDGIFFYPNYGPWFGNGPNIGFGSDFLTKSYCYFSQNNGYQDSLGKGMSIVTGEQNNNNELTIKEVEVFKLSK